MSNNEIKCQTCVHTLPFVRTIPYDCVSRERWSCKKRCQVIVCCCSKAIYQECDTIRISRRNLSEPHTWLVMSTMNPNTDPYGISYLSIMARHCARSLSYFCFVSCLPSDLFTTVCAKAAVSRASIARIHYSRAGFVQSELCRGGGTEMPRM